jgi:hypothetical protein
MNATCKAWRDQPRDARQEGVSVARARRSAFFSRRDDWLKWIETQLVTPESQQSAREIGVSPHTTLALAAVIGDSGESFAGEGIWAKQETLAAKLAKRLIRAKADVRLVRRGTNLLAKIGALSIESRSGRSSLLVPLLAGNRLYDAVETEGVVGTPPSATADANVRPTPDANVGGPRTEASYESSYLNPHIQNLHTNPPPHPQLGEGGGEEPIVMEREGSGSDTHHQQQAAADKESGFPSRSEPEDNNQTSSPEHATEPIIEGEILPREDAFEDFWNACAEPRGPLGFALIEWRKLSHEEQHRAFQRPSRNGTFAGSWLRERAFDLPSDIIERPYSPNRNGFATIAAMTDDDDCCEIDYRLNGQ